MLSSCISPKACRNWCWRSAAPQGSRNIILVVLLCFIPYLTTAYIFLSLMISGALSACWGTCAGEEAFAGFHRNQGVCVFWGSNAAGTPSPWRKVLWAADSQSSAVGHAALLGVIPPKTLCVNIYGQYHADPTKAGGLALVDPVTDSCPLHLLCS